MDEGDLEQYYKEMIQDGTKADSTEIERLSLLVTTVDLSQWILRWPKAMSALAVQLNPSNQNLSKGFQQKEDDYKKKRRNLLRKLLNKLKILQQKKKAVEMLSLGDSTEFQKFVEEDKARHRKTTMRRRASRKRQAEQRTQNRKDKAMCLQQNPLRDPTRIIQTTRDTC